VAVLGLGRIGSAVADLLASGACAPHLEATIAGALVRSADGRRATTPFPICTEPLAIFDARPDVVIEVLGGLEPARTVVLEALSRGIPVVTANKTLIATYGDELFAAATRFGTPLRCEAAVVAGVPFLGTFAARPLAASVDRVTAILNGTSNFVLSRVDGGVAFEEALADARRLGYAEPDPSKDVDGSDAAEKLAILVRHFARLSIRPSGIAAESIENVGPDEMRAARALGGRIKPVAVAEWSSPDLGCFAGPAFLPEDDLLGGLGGVLNGVRLERRGSAAIHLIGPGAGPEVTARAVLDDVVEALGGRQQVGVGALPRASVGPPASQGYFVTLRATSLPDAVDVADLLAAHGVWIRRWDALQAHPDGELRAFLTFPCLPDELLMALRALAAASACAATSRPIVEARRD
jgi:homoserine dehydrogenase